MIRSFIAIPLPDNIKRDIRDRIDSFGKTHISITPYNNLHLTLYFLGDILEEAVDKISEKLRNLSRTRAEFVLRFRGVDAFRDRRGDVKVIFIPLIEGLEAVRGLYREVGMLIKPYIKEEKEYTPHLTIGRVRKNVPRQELEDFMGTLEGIEIERVLVSGITFFRSELNRRGAIHTPIDVVEFSAKKFEQMLKVKRSPKNRRKKSFGKY